MSFPSTTNIREDFYRHFQLEVKALKAQISQLKDPSLIASDQAAAIDDCLAGISRLSIKVQDASSYTPVHDQRTYSEALKALSESLQEARSTLAPKRKFAFKSPPKTYDAALPAGASTEPATFTQGRHVPGYQSNSNLSPDLHTSNPGSTPCNRTSNNSSSNPEPNSVSQASHPDSSVPSNSITVSSANSTHITLPLSSLSTSSPASINNLRNCIVDLSASKSGFANLTIHTVTNTLLICGTVNGAAHITGVTNSMLVISSRQVRMHECTDCTVYLRCSSRPIIEDCRGIRFAPLPDVYDRSQSPSQTPAPTPPENRWDQVDDFKWLKAEHSPNWSILLSEDVVRESVWRDLLSGKAKAMPVDEILRAVGIGGEA